MESYEEEVESRASSRLGIAAGEDLAQAHAAFMNRVYRFMALGLGASGVTALAIASSPEASMVVAQNLWGFVIAELVLVFALSGFAEKLSSTAAAAMFLAYAVLSGVTLSVLFLVYTRGSIASTFFVTGGTFAAMSLYATKTKKDLSSWGSFLTMGLIGLIIASLVNLFLKSPMLYWVSTYIGVIVFVGLTAYDTQKVSNYFFAAETQEDRKKLAINGALTLYLDFVNLFIYLLRIFGRRR